MAILKNTTIDDTGFVMLPSGTTAERPSAANGMLRYNSTLSVPEIYQGGNWQKVVSGKVGDWAYKEGPVSYNNAYISNWNMGQVQGDSMDATTYGYGILIKETGRYYCFAGHRVVAENNFAGFSLNGDRATLETRNDILWGHDHSGQSDNWSKSIMLGYLEANWIISFGPPSNYGGQYTVQGYSGFMQIIRLK